jgi:hypothetical protein
MKIPTVQLKADRSKCEATIDGTKGSMVPAWESNNTSLVAIHNDIVRSNHVFKWPRRRPRWNRWKTCSPSLHLLL